jgi:Uma2 family endonuclease
MPLILPGPTGRRTAAGSGVRYRGDRRIVADDGGGEMTSALDWEHVPSDGWTVDDLDALPEDGVRRELLDGVLLVSPSPTNIHQTIAMLLGAALERRCPDQFDVTQGVEVRISPRRSFIPDVLVTTAEAAARGPRWFAPHEVVLAVEIVSPSSYAMDRFTKPALLAQAGVPCYWRIETEDALTVHAHRLEPIDKLYVQIGTFTKIIELSEPWETVIPVAEIAPRWLR